MHKTHWNSQNCRKTIAKKQQESSQPNVSGISEGPGDQKGKGRHLQLVILIPVFVGKLLTHELRMSYPANKWAANQNG
jgi:hypothetical protein